MAKNETVKNSKQITKNVGRTALNLDAKGISRAIRSWIEASMAAKELAGPVARLWIVGAQSKARWPKSLPEKLPEWLKSSKKMSVSWTAQTGPVTVLRLGQDSSEETREHRAQFRISKYARARDSAGAWIKGLDAISPGSIELHFENCHVEEVQGFLLGCELAQYSFKTAGMKLADQLPKLQIWHNAKPIKSKELMPTLQLGRGVNLARHLTNLPANQLNPASYADLVTDLFRGSAGFTVEILSGDRLQRENMNLLMAVGGAAEHGPCLVHLKYRPRGVKAQRPIAIVGKGITFDSGGLDIKPSSGMRLMKKDMGGSASALGLAFWVRESQVKTPCDFYLSLAENSVGPKSFRPGDVIVARNGQAIEISNTDAEGRLVLADAMDFAVKATGPDAPRVLIDLATLTGAIKVGLGAQIAGLFANSDALARALESAATESGEPVWRMPLFQKYRSSMKSSVSDMTNSVEGFGGAITAALFLENFVGKVPWAHLDIYAWTDSAEGALSEAGANGQMVQTLARWLQKSRA